MERELSPRMVESQFTVPQVSLVARVSRPSKLFRRLQ